MRLSIRWKLILGLGLPLLLIYAAALAIVASKLQERWYARMRQNVTQLAGHYAARLDGQFRTFAQVGLTTAEFLTVQPHFSEEDIFAILERNVQQDPLIYGSCISFEPYSYSPDRRLYCPYVFRGEGDTLQRMDVADAYDYTDPKWAWYRVPRETGEAMWTEPFFDDGAGDIIMCTFVAPFFRDGKFRGTVNVDIPLDKLQHHAGETAVAGETFIVISREGRFIVYPDDSFIMHESVFSLAERLNRPDLAEVGRKMVAGRSGVERLVGFPSDEPSLLFFAPIASTGWSLSAVVPEAQVLAFEREQLVFGVSAMLTALLVITVVLWFTARRMTRPIERLAEAAHEVAAGNLQTQAVDVRSSDEIGELARAFNKMIRDLRRHVTQLTAATREREAVESELRVARNIQNALLPRTFPPFPHLKEFQLHAVNAPARHIAGDFFDFFFVDDDVLMVVIADVSGKGVPAAMFMAVARTIIRNLASTCPSPGLLLTRANALLIQDNAESMFVTMFICRYNIRTGRLVYANAGHPRPYVADVQGQVRPFGDITGTVVGVLPGLTFTEASAELAVGEKLVLYTDGVTEARSPSGQFFHSGGFETFLRSNSHLPPESLCKACIDSLIEYQAGEIADDITMLVLQRQSP